MKYILILYFLIINILAFALMGIDKRRAQRDMYRIPEKTLLLTALFGGAFGALIGMNHFRHKTRHWYFKYGIPFFLILHIALVALYYVFK